VHFRQIAQNRFVTDCTATLIHPRVISLAAHCTVGIGPREIVFGDTNDHGPLAVRRVAVQSCTARPNWDRVGEDFAFCMLAEEVSDVPIIPVLFGCEEKILTVGAPVVLVGYGNVDPNTPSPGGHKRAVQTMVAAMPTDQRTIGLGDAFHGACINDSGGPAFVRLADGSWRMFGADGVTQAACASPGTWAYVPHYVAWAEQMSGVDLTPCHDAQTGQYTPGPSCANVPLNPEVSDGTWAHMCTEHLAVSGPLAMCGDPVVDAGIAPSDARRDATGTSAIDGAASGTGGAEAGSDPGVGAGAGGGIDTGGSGGDDPVGGAAGAGGDFPNGRPIRSSNLNQIGRCTCRFGQRAGTSNTLAVSSLGALLLAMRRRRRSNRATTSN
jgi:hypothetical protein